MISFVLFHHGSNVCWFLNVRAWLRASTLTFGVGRAEIKLNDYLSIMDKQTLHVDPTQPLSEAFAIFDRWVS